MASISIVSKFSKAAPGLRKFFEQQFSDSRSFHSKRFVWDPWFIANQYSLLRTPAESYFPSAVYKKFEQELIKYGQSVLGCAELTPPWLSIYTEGHFQNWHADNPHGPWAYVFSLTPWQGRRFSGGETVIMKEQTLDYWRSQDLTLGIEESDLLTKIPAKFNQLLVFDPKLPHSVSEVRGVRNPLEGRLVIHGWFTEPCPFVEGGLSILNSGDWLDERLQAVTTKWAGVLSVFGSVSMQISISSSGKTRLVKALASGLRSFNGSVNRDVKKMKQDLMSVQWPKASRASTLTIPFIFE